MQPYMMQAYMNGQMPSVPMTRTAGAFRILSGAETTVLAAEGAPCPAQRGG